MIITTFGSNRLDAGSGDYEFCYQLGKLLAEHGYTLCNGGYGGTMEVTAKGAREGGGKTIGVTVAQFGPANPWIQEERRCSSLFERLQTLIKLGQAFIIMKGATGTLVELAVCWELINKGLMKAKPAVLAGDYWLPVVRLISAQLPGQCRQSEYFDFPSPDFLLRADKPVAIIALLDRQLKKPE